MKQTGIYTIEEIKNKLTPIFEERGVIKAVLFGSYAKGEATEYSDVDIVAQVEDWIDDLDFCGISVDISDSLGKSVHFLDLTELIPNSIADKEIRSTGRVIFDKKV
ncbi:MAG: nucleotidyltransferase domain-containing protein [Defluviitaleaceae bacterium]|nr:nucleotidyltransferase domain-containing protein [Defluviitaleaceae bacterium]